MGILLDFSKIRANEAKSELQEFTKGPVKYFRTNQPLRKALLLEFLELLRPEKNAQYEHKIVDWKGSSEKLLG